ncbi:Holliday junction branch migration protein RuvA [Cellulomonas shaoxiangyii]|uniref:Holliday junction branch migration complex subunit RuvA n=1 Tax=Cellulomonas shaoxiangyii TaxID=2566013 RepID=A0A4P7SIS0_9CELL|nr:Holliday junction branch migration protein RuvA [Cellulomonas shaoxiangyii]QCB93671.1 Holliday junction branch migration protein RuvA [Cellulomonas shaoxiangyii]TGY86152.1 Holliday junction branch migration protein RuvA [Cellulomonas shaoxiangyii]
MIASVHGTVLTVRLDAAVVEVGGVGMLVQATPTTLAGLRVGTAARLFTSLVVREDSLTLFGFADADERDVFEVLQTVTGVGPRLALAMLAVHTPDGLRRAVAEEDLAALMRVPGIGRKGAQRIVLELGDRLGAPAPAAGGPARSAAAADHREQVVDALVGLGWPLRAAQDAVAGVLDGGSEPVGAEEVPGVLRAALRVLGGSRA